jgi:hypothetical protein
MEPSSEIHPFPLGAPRFLLEGKRFRLPFALVLNEGESSKNNAFTPDVESADTLATHQLGFRVLSIVNKLLISSFTFLTGSGLLGILFVRY